VAIANLEFLNRLNVFKRLQPAFDIGGAHLIPFLCLSRLCVTPSSNQLQLLFSRLTLVCEKG
jgi:hypothetical protein